jgi:pimeloyl-ACP methyl ester carboxylesterase
VPGGDREAGAGQGHGADRAGPGLHREADGARAVDEARAAIAKDGFWIRPSEYDDGGYAITRELLEDGARWSILQGVVPIEVPVRVLQGGADPDVPWTHALELANSLKSDDVVFTLIKDGDHRLSRPQDLERLVTAVSEAKSLIELDADPVARRLARAARARNASIVSAEPWAAADIGPDEE